MTALNVLTNAFRNVGIDVASPSVTGPGFQSQQMVRFINESGLDVARRAQWSQMIGSDTVTGPTSSHALPSDFYALAERGAVYRTKSAWQPVRVIVSPEEWAFLSIRSTTQPYCHLNGGNLLFSPQIDSDGAVMRYVSSQWVSGKDAVTADSDVFLVPERLVEKGAIWRWKRQNGLPYEDMLSEFEADLATELRADRGAH